MATLLEKIIDKRVGQTLVGTVSAAVDRIAEEIVVRRSRMRRFAGLCVS